MRSKNVRDSDTINIIFIETCEPSLLQKINKRHRNANQNLGQTYLLVYYFHNERPEECPYYHLRPLSIHDKYPFLFKAILSQLIGYDIVTIQILHNFDMHSSFAFKNSVFEKQNTKKLHADFGYEPSIFISTFFQTVCVIYIFLMPRDLKTGGMLFLSCQSFYLSVILKLTLFTNSVFKVIVRAFIFHKSIPSYNIFSWLSTVFTAWP